MRVRRGGVCARLARLLCGLLLIHMLELPQLEALDEGDPCTVKPNLPGICRLSSQCEQHVDKYIKMGILTGQEIPSCGLGTLEEIVCCPAAECCPGDSSPRQVTPQEPQPIATRATTPAPITTLATTTEHKSMLDQDSSFFDFQQLLHPPQPEPQTQPQPHSQPQPQPQPSPQPQPQQIFQPDVQVDPIQNGMVPLVTHEAMRSPPGSEPTGSRTRGTDMGWTSQEPEPVTTPVPTWMGQFQSMGPLGTAPPTDRQPKVINRPQSLRPSAGQGSGMGRFPDNSQDFQSQSRPVHGTGMERGQRPGFFPEDSQDFNSQSRPGQGRGRGPRPGRFQDESQDFTGQSRPGHGSGRGRGPPTSRLPDASQDFSGQSRPGQGMGSGPRPGRFQTDSQDFTSQPRPVQGSERSRPDGIPADSQDPNDLIKLVNDRLRQQGMDIQPARQVDTFTIPTTTTRTTIISPIDADPWAPFRFREPPQDEVDANDLGTGSAEVFGGDTTTTRTIQPTPTTRVNVVPDPNRPAARACRIWENGPSEPQLEPHILDGIPVSDGFYPHMAAIAFNSFGTIAYRCGGSLISKRHVLTAAHCVNLETPTHVRLGTVDIDKVNNNYQDIDIKNISIHSDYVSTFKYNDIAILELAREITISANVYPACLELEISDPPAASQLFVAGWGIMNQTIRSTSKILLRAPLQIVPLLQCNKSIMDEQPTAQRLLAEGVKDTLVCAADTRRQKADACQGDSGGPLILERDKLDNKFSILGVISSGFGCATKTPGLYTRVASYLDYIESIVWPNNIVPPI